jgi:hypothetical protein
MRKSPSRKLAEVLEDLREVLGTENVEVVAITRGRKFLPSHIEWSQSDEEWTYACSEGRHWIYSYQGHSDRFDFYRFRITQCDCAPPINRKSIFQ